MKRRFCAAHIFLMELSVEDIPVRFLPRAREELERSVREILEASKLPVQGLRVWMTPRRISVFIEGLPQSTERESHTVFGPREDTLRDGQGRWTQRVVGFARSQGIAPEQIRLENGRLSCVKIIEPRSVVEILKQALPQAVFSIPFPKTMRWERSQARFARPIRAISAWWDKKLLRDWRWVPSAVPRPEIWVAGAPLRLRGAADYEQKLRSRKLYLDEEKRRRILEKELSRKTAGYEIASHPALLAELLHLVEIPKVAVGGFRQEYLSLPSEVVTAILAKVKLVALSREGRLAPRFAAVIEALPNNRHLKTVVAGYERVVQARLFDAKFFWDQDIKIPLRVHAEKLKNIVFCRDMGSMGDKVERVRRSALALAKHIEGAQDTALIEEAAAFYKADLATSLVGEYAELAGKVGCEYARVQGINQEVCNVMMESAQLDPATAGASSLALGLAEHLDTLLAQFSLGHRPTAAQDPWGLKKLADVVIAASWLKKVNCSLRHMVDRAWESFPPDKVDARRELLQYLRARIVLRAKEEGYAPDRIEAVMAGMRFRDLPAGDIADCLAAFRRIENGRLEILAGMAGSFKRISNILRQASADETGALVDRTLFAHPVESALWEKISRSLEIFEDAVKRGAYEAAFEEAAGFAGPLEEFFKAVMVMTEDPKIRRNRLALLSQIQRMVLHIIDPSKLVLAHEKAPLSTGTLSG